MLIEFKVNNFRSVGEEQILSLVPSTNQKEFQANILTEGNNIALNVIALYGANGSGKSNLLKSLGVFFEILKNSAKGASTDRLNYDPFLLRDGWADKPTVFEMVFSMKEIRYRYGFSYDETNILKEWLFRKTVGREVNVFQREGDIIDPSSSLKANAKIIDAAIEATRSNSLFLATMDMLNIAEANSIFEYLNTNAMIDGRHSYNFGKMEGLSGSDSITKKVTDHLRRLKLGMIDVVTEQVESSKHNSLCFTEYKVMATHSFYDQEGQPTAKKVSWDYLERESSGSVKALELSTPVILLLQLGGVVIIDEIEAKMHPLLTLDLINLFLDKQTNPNNVQLIFSTHDTNLLSYAHLRRDQIYFAEKNAWESTEIYSLSDFVYVNETDGSETKERPDTDKEKRYIEGRYGAVPVLGPLGKLKHTING